MDPLLVALQVLAATAALVVAYAAAFLYEDEEKQVEDRLQAWWVRLSDLDGGLVEKAREVLRKSYEIADRVANRMLGDNIISWRAISTSVVVSYCVTAALVIATSPFWVDAYHNPSSILLTIAGDSIRYDMFCFALIAGTGIPTILRGRSPTTAAVLALLVPTVVVFARVSRPYIHDLPSYLISAASGSTIWINLLTDYLALSQMRNDMRKLGKRYPISTAILAPIKMAVLIGAMLWIIDQVKFYHAQISFPPDVQYRWTENSASLLVASTPAILFSCFAFVVPVALVIGRASVLFVSRFVYAAHRHRLIQNKKLLWTSAVVLSAVSGYDAIGTTLVALVAGKPPI